MNYILKVSLFILLTFSSIPSFSQKKNKKTNQPKKQNVEKPWYPKVEGGCVSIGFVLNKPQWVESDEYGSGCGNRKDVLINKTIVSIISGVKICEDSTKLFQIIWMDSAQYSNILFSENPQIPSDMHFMYINKDSVNFKEGTSDEIFSKINSLSYQDKLEFSTRAVQQLSFSIQIFRVLEIETHRDKQRNKLSKFLSKTAKLGLLILDWSFYDESEYTNGSSIKFKIYNPTKKTIKYIWFYMKGINPVGDAVVGRNGKSIIELKAVGPIEYNDSGTYNFEYVWYTDLVYKAKITSIKVQYMDNSIKIIKSPKDIMMPSELIEFINSNN